MPGTTVTFYSYKGGVGRTFTLANIAVLLAQWRYRVLVIDWDIEAPGLAHYFRPWTKKLSTGVLEFLRDCRKGAVRPWHSYTVAVDLPDLENSLTLMPAGAGRKAYIQQVQRIDWDELYELHDLGNVVENLRQDWVEHFDFILIDARTGITDFSGLLTAQLPDILAFMFTANYQSLDGVCDVVDRAADARQRLPYDRSAFFALPLPARFEVSEDYDQANKWRQIIADKVTRFLRPWNSKDVEPKRLIDHLIIPYFPYWSFGEEIAVLKETAGSPQTSYPGVISFSFETIAALLAHRLGRTDLLDRSRDDYVHSARRAGTRGELSGFDVFLSYTQRDASVAQEIADVLRMNNFVVFFDKEGLKPGEPWSNQLEEALNRSRNMVVVFGDRPERSQIHEVNTFLRQSIDDERRRGVVPIFTSTVAQTQPLPTVVSSLQALNLDEGRESTLDQLLTRLTRPI